jgi:CBS domain-containing protein
MSNSIRQMLDRKGWGAVVVTRRQPIPSVAQFLKAHKIGAAPVVDDHGSVVGMLSERDIARGLGEFGDGILEKVAEDLMTRLVASCTPDQTALDIMQLMTTVRCRHVPVIVNGRLKGMVSIGDVVKMRLEEAQSEVETLRSYITTA